MYIINLYNKRKKHWGCDISYIKNLDKLYAYKTTATSRATCTGRASDATISYWAATFAGGSRATPTGGTTTFTRVTCTPVAIEAIPVATGGTCAWFTRTTLT